MLIDGKTQEAYRAIFHTEDGKIVLRDLVNQHYLLAPLYKTPDDRSDLIAFREGGRNAILRILAIAGYSLEPISTTE